MARDNEDRIVELQNKVDDMNLEVIKQRREIQEYKGKEKNSLEQIGAVNIQKTSNKIKSINLKYSWNHILQTFNVLKLIKSKFICLSRCCLMRNVASCFKHIP
jgi:hypothetical protein